MPVEWSRWRSTHTERRSFALVVVLGERGSRSEGDKPAKSVEENCSAVPVGMWYRQISTHRSMCITPLTRSGTGSRAGKSGHAPCLANSQAGEDWGGHPLSASRGPYASEHTRQSGGAPREQKGPCFSLSGLCVVSHFFAWRKEGETLVGSMRSEREKRLLSIFAVQKWMQLTPQ